MREEVVLLKSEVGQGGGFIITLSHEIHGDSPLENLLALIDAVREN